MNPQQSKNELESLSSISIDPALRDFNHSTIFGGRKSSFEYVNILKDSADISKRDFRNSLDILASNINNGKQLNPSSQNFIQAYNDQAKVKIQQQGGQALQIGEVYSESENEQSQKKPPPQKKKFSMATYMDVQPPLKLQTVYSDISNPYHSFFPHDLATVLRDRQIPLQYVRGLLMARNLKEIKSTRRLKVERYLQKRRKKTWNRKICYNCRQKVAEQRLRIKGKFIKKRRAMEMLGLKQPIDTPTLREMLQELLKNKNSKQIDELIKKQKYLKKEEGNQEESSSSILDSIISQQSEQYEDQDEVKLQN